MRRSPAVATVILSATVLLYATGCQAAGFRFLSLIGAEKRPFSVALVVDRPAEAAEAMDPFASYKPLQQALARHLGRPVAVNVCFPSQVQLCLGTGWYDLAVVTPTHYAHLEQPEAFRVVAASVDKQGHTARSALLVVAAGSTLQNARELRGKVVAFGPLDDARTHHAALLFLRGAGLMPTDLSLEMPPVTGSLRHLADAREGAQAVLSGGAAAGFIDQAAWEELPEHAAAEGEPARDKLRAIGRTIALPTRLLIASPHLDNATFERVRAFALAVGKEHPEVMEPLTSSGYAVPDERILSACRSLIQAEKAPRPASTLPATKAD